MTSIPTTELLTDLVSRCRFPAAGSRVDCAVSGGADSLALLVLAVAAGCRPTAIHVDHGLREGSHAEGELVRLAAERLGAAFVSERVTVAAGPNLEARARAARYAVLPSGVLTGHTADDQAETVLLNLIRGAGLDGMAGMSSVGRPLLGLRRSETRALCAQLGIEWVCDPSNDDRAFRRNRVRHELLPLLDALADRDVAPVVARNAELTRTDVEFLDMLAASIDPTDASALAAAPLSLGRRAVRGWLRAGEPEQHPPSASVVERVLAVARGEARAADIGGGRRVARTRGRLRIEVRLTEHPG